MSPPDEWGITHRMCQKPRLCRGFFVGYFTCFKAAGPSGALSGIPVNQEG